MMKPASMCIGLCPCCGQLQISMPTEGDRGVTVAIDHDNAVDMAKRLMELLIMFDAGKPYEGGMLPIDCCAERMGLSKH